MAEKKTKPEKLSRVLYRAVKESGKHLSEIVAGSGVSFSNLMRFLANDRPLLQDEIDALAATSGWSSSRARGRRRRNFGEPWLKRAILKKTLYRCVLDYPVKQMREYRLALKFGGVGRASFHASQDLYDYVTH